jgi:hypothetical protein
VADPLDPALQTIAPSDHPLRTFIALVAAIALGLLAVLVLRPRDEGPAAALEPRIGTSLRLVIRTEPGAAPDDREWLEPVTPVELADREGVASVHLLLDGMSPIGEPGAPAPLWIPLERVLEVWVGAERIYFRSE